MAGNKYAQVEAKRHWDSAHQSATLEDVRSLLPSQSKSDLLAFEDVRQKLRLHQKMYKGVQDIPLDQIIGSVGRYRDFTRSFLPRNKALMERWQRVDAATITKGVPPIEVYLVGEAYFVIDGNHRVSVMRQNNAGTIQAHVWEFETETGLSSDADLDEVLIKAEHIDFLERTNLKESHPEADIEFTVPGRYRDVEYQIEMYRRALEKIDEEPMSYQDGAAMWYDMVYAPACDIIRRQGVMDRFPDRTEADLFVWVWRYNQDLREDGERILLADTADAIAGTPRGGIFGKVWQSIRNLFS